MPETFVPTEVFPSHGLDRPTYLDAFRGLCRICTYAEAEDLWHVLVVTAGVTEANVRQPGTYRRLVNAYLGSNSPAVRGIGKSLQIRLDSHERLALRHTDREASRQSDAGYDTDERLGA